MGWFNDIHKWFETLISEANGDNAWGLELLFDATDPPANKKSARLTTVLGDAQLEAFGAVRTHGVVGLFYVSVFLPRSAGDGELLSLCDSICDVLRGVVDVSVETFSPTVGPATEDGGLLTRVIKVEFWSSNTF